MIFAGPSAQGRVGVFLFFVLVCYPPLSPQGPPASVPGRLGKSSDPVEGHQHHGFCTRSLLKSTFFISGQIVKKRWFFTFCFGPW